VVLESVALLRLEVKTMYSNAELKSLLGEGDGNPSSNCRNQFKSTGVGNQQAHHENDCCQSTGFGDTHQPMGDRKDYLPEGHKAAVTCFWKGLEFSNPEASPSGLPLACSAAGENQGRPVWQLRKCWF